MARLTMEKRELERLVERALESACAYNAIGNYKLMYLYWGEANVYLSLLEDMDVWYDEVTINEHVQAMLDIMHDENGKLQVVRI